MTPKERLHQSLIQGVERIKPTIFLTLNVTHTRKPLKTAPLVTELLKRVERRAHGSRWAKFPADLRLHGYAFLEHPGSNPHWHCPLAGPTEIEQALLEHALPIWRKLTKTGHGHVELIRDVEAVSRYVTKVARAEWSFDSFVAYAPRSKQ